MTEFEFIADLFEPIHDGRVSGVFVLTLNSTAIYVGAAVDIARRVSFHRSSRRPARFSAAHCIPNDRLSCGKDVAKAMLICALAPVCNGKREPGWRLRNDPFWNRFDNPAAARRQVAALVIGDRTIRDDSVIAQLENLYRLAAGLMSNV